MISKALTLDDIRNDSELTNDCRVFYGNIKSLKVFGNYCNMKSFVYLFGNEEGERLWHCFAIDAKRNIYDLFFQYLNNEQMFVLAANIIKNKNLEMSVI